MAEIEFKLSDGTLGMLNDTKGLVKRVEDYQKLAPKNASLY